MKMNQIAKNLWVAALRSDSYKQTTGAFRKRGMVGGESKFTEFCGLGVLHQVYRENEAGGTEFLSYGTKYGKWIGVDHNEGDLETELDIVIQWNDEEHLTFKEIADKIEEAF